MKCLRRLVIIKRSKEQNTFLLFSCGKKESLKKKNLPLGWTYMRVPDTSLSLCKSTLCLNPTSHFPQIHVASLFRPRVRGPLHRSRVKALWCSIWVLNTQPCCPFESHLYLLPHIATTFSFCLLNTSGLSQLCTSVPIISLFLEYSRALLCLIVHSFFCSDGLPHCDLSEPPTQKWLF